MTPKVSMIAAIGKGRVLGKKNALLWTIPDDLKRFKELTQGHPCIMGRNTYDSILAMIGKPLPKRTSIVLSIDPLPAHQDVVPASSVEDALNKAKALGSNEIFICGGASIYSQFLPLADKLYLTLIDDEKDGDVYFPAYEDQFTKKVSGEQREYKGLPYVWVDLER